MAFLYLRSLTKMSCPVKNFPFFLWYLGYYRCHLLSVLIRVCFFGVLCLVHCESVLIFQEGSIISDVWLMYKITVSQGWCYSDFGLFYSHYVRRNPCQWRSGCYYGCSSIQYLNGMFSARIFWMRTYCNVIYQMKPAKWIFLKARLHFSKCFATSRWKNILCYSEL